MNTNSETLLPSNQPGLSTALFFTITIDHKCFMICYETESRERNNIRDIKYDGFSLDIKKIITHNYNAYTQIRNATQNNSESHWEDMEAEKGIVLPKILKG